MLNLSVLLEEAARRHPDRDAVVLGDASIDYKTLDPKANQVANRLVARGLRLLDRATARTPFPIAAWLGLHPRELDRLTREDEPR